MNNTVRWETYTPFSLGASLEDTFKRLDAMASSGTSYPPYNIKKLDETGKAKRVTDKMPANFSALGKMLAILPDAKIIHTQRLHVP